VGVFRELIETGKLILLLVFVLFLAILLLPLIKITRTFGNLLLRLSDWFEDILAQLDISDPYLDDYNRCL